jgi:hypothetical protein
MSGVGVAGVLSRIDEVQPARLLLAKLFWRIVYHCERLTARVGVDGWANPHVARLNGRDEIKDYFGMLANWREIGR